MTKLVSNIAFLLVVLTLSACTNAINSNRSIDSLDYDLSLVGTPEEVGLESTLMAGEAVSWRRVTILQADASSDRRVTFLDPRSQTSALATRSAQPCDFSEPNVRYLVWVKKLKQGQRIIDAIPYILVACIELDRESSFGFIKD